MNDQIRQIREEYAEEDVDEEVLEAAIEVVLQADEPQENQDPTLRHPLKWWLSLSSGEQDDVFWFGMYVMMIGCVVFMFAMMLSILLI